MKLEDAFVSKSKYEENIVMKIIDIGKIPSKIGEAEIILQPRHKNRYDSGFNDPIAYREDNQIIIDPKVNGRFFSILGGRQFLYTGDDENRDRHMFFGGMDESPFLVEVDYKLVEELALGEDAFFNSLKPSVVKRWEKGLGSEAKRQGDFFAVASDKKVNWDSFFMSHLDGGKITMSFVKDFALRDTRHNFTGILGEINDLLVGEGRIDAPDHEPLLLEQPHLIEQAEGLLNPVEAD